MDSGLKKILLVQCEAEAREPLVERLYADTASFRLLTAADLPQALELLATDDIFLAVIALNAAREITSLKEICAGYPHTEVVLLLPPDRPPWLADLPAHARLHQLPRPLDGETLGHLVNELARGHHQGFAGTLKNIQLDDLIQMCCLSTATITIRVRQGLQQGTIHIWDGEIVHAECGNQTGEEAFYAILGWRSGSFETLDGGISEVATIKKGYEFLLMEAARRADEADMAEAPAAEDEEPARDEAPTLSADKLRVLMVEDSTVMGKILTSMLSVSGDMDVVGVARNGEEALTMSEALKPDLILLDVNMPVMSGKAALKHIMIKHPCPVVVMSNVGSGSPEAVLAFLELGAVDFMAKPVKTTDMLLQQQKIVERVRRAAQAQIAGFQRRRPPAAAAPPEMPPPEQRPAQRLVVVSCGCSAHSAFNHLTATLAPQEDLTVIGLQDIPPAFVPALCTHLTRGARYRPAPLADGGLLRGAHVYLGTHGCSLRLLRENDDVQTRLQPGRQDFGFGPSYFDLFLYSASDCFGPQLLIVLLSGAETGNLEGLRYARENGAQVWIQDPATSIMPTPLVTVQEAFLVDDQIDPETIAVQVDAWIGADRP
jgi:two-component system chemotaxis response regulator CheB